MKRVTALTLLCAVVLGMSGCGKTSDQANNERTEMRSDVIDNIMTRASVREFTTEPVTEAQIETLLRAAMAAPTAMNRQPWHFVVVTDETKLDSIQQYKSPLAIVVCGDTTKVVEGNLGKWWVCDTSLASQNILLAAHSMGLGGVWTSVYPREDVMQKVTEVLELPEHLIPLNVLILGHPEEVPEAKDKWNTENISWNSFGTTKE